jgi:hypothetical protein
MPIEVFGLNETIKDCQEAPELIKELMLPSLVASLLSLLPDLADYPPRPSTSNYVRTGTLGRLWTAAQPEFKALKSGFEARIGNKTPYAGYVQGGKEDDPHQAWMHKKRWQTTDQILAKHQPDIEARLQAAIEDINLELGR